MAFHVPEVARVQAGPFGSSALDDGDNGAFLVPSLEPGWLLLVIACDGTVFPDDDPAERAWDGWEHVSVHAATKDGTVRAPTWPEMCQVKDLFWDADDVVMQLHPRAADAPTTPPHVLHLWRHRHLAIPEPPRERAGPVAEAVQ